MNLIRIAVVLALVLIVHPVLAGDDLCDVQELKREMPPEVASLLSRIVECNHWGGEEPYDKERAREIGRAIERLRCSQLDRDETGIRDKYKNRKNMLLRIDNTKEFCL